MLWLRFFLVVVVCCCCLLFFRVFSCFSLFWGSCWCYFFVLFVFLMSVATFYCLLLFYCHLLARLMFVCVCCSCLPFTNNTHNTHTHTHTRTRAHCANTQNICKFENNSYCCYLTSLHSTFHDFDFDSSNQQDNNYVFASTTITESHIRRQASLTRDKKTFNGIIRCCVET